MDTTSNKRQRRQRALQLAEVSLDPAVVHAPELMLHMTLLEGDHGLWHVWYLTANGEVRRSMQFHSAEDVQEWIRDQWEAPATV